MTKNLKLFLFIIILPILLMFILVDTVYASNTKSSIVVVDSVNKIKQLPNNQGYVSKRIKEIDSNNNEITIELKLQNFEQQLTETKHRNTEIFIIIPGKFNEIERLEYANIVSQLANNIFSKSDKVKIGLIEIQGPNLHNVVGKANDSVVIVEPTRNINNLVNGINNITNKSKLYVNLESAIKLAKKSYSSNANKILISLNTITPSSAIGISNNVYVNSSIGETVEGAVNRKYRNLVNQTKDAIFDLRDSNIELYLIRPENIAFNQVWRDTGTKETVYEFDGSSYIDELYGKIGKPIYRRIIYITR